MVIVNRVDLDYNVETTFVRQNYTYCIPCTRVLPITTGNR